MNDLLLKLLGMDQKEAISLIIEKGYSYRILGNINTDDLQYNRINLFIENGAVYHAANY